jgi:hypothetical protein
MGAMSRLFGAGKAATKMYQADAEAKKAMRDRPPPARRAKAPPPPQPTNQSKANVAADTFGVPGRETARKAGNRTARELEKLGL